MLTVVAPNCLCFQYVCLLEIKTLSVFVDPDFIASISTVTSYMYNTYRHLSLLIKSWLHESFDSY